MKKIVYIDMDNVLVDFQSGIDKQTKESRLLFEGRMDEVPGIFSLMKPMPDAVDVFNELTAVFDVYILSTAPWNNPSAWTDKLNWVKQYLGESAHKRLILTHHKNLNKGHYLIDDRDKNGADEFEGELMKFGSDQFKNWMAVRDYLIPQEKLV
jgi:5'(3')-deoxyribonucleotidase